MSDPFNLSDRFPTMRPVSRAPTLHTINFVGLTMSGRRDEDPETGTYVSTHVFSVLFLPLFALGAYRIADAEEGGYYFLGKVPLSGFARAWNLLFCLALLGGGCYLGWNSYTGTPAYVAGRKIDEADRLLASDPGRSAVLYHEVMTTGPADRAATARQKLQTLINTPPATGPEALAVLRVALEAHRSNHIPLPDLFERGRKVAEGVSAQDPRSALDVIELVAPLADQQREPLAIRRRLLEPMVRQQPDDIDLACRLAEVYEALGEQQRCEKLLAPHEPNLGTRKGAAILGRVHAAKGRVDRAIALLEPFVTASVAQMTAAENAYRAALDRAQQAAIADLKSNKAKGFDYAKYQKATKQVQQEMVETFIGDHCRADQGIKAAAVALGQQSAVVPAALDLGLMQLQRAQQQPDPAQRKADLERAEKTFLSVRNAAGETDTFRLSLAQVYYWLGKHQEGRKLFDEVLATHKRSTEVMGAVARVLRDVGATSEARKLVEEAYEKEAATQPRQQMALLRSLMPIDLDDQIAWLARCDASSKEVQASLSSSRGHKAAGEGRDEEASNHYRQAIRTYAEMHENSATLNNSALVHFALFALTFEREQYTRGLDKLERALALQPGDSILLTNAAHSVLANTLLDVVGGKVDLRLIRQSADWSQLSFLFTDEAGRRALATALRKHPGTIRARTYLEKGLLLAPKRPGPYETLARLYAFLDDDRGLESVWQRLAASDLDLEQRQQRARDYLAGKDDAKHREEFTKAHTRAEKQLEAARKKGGVTLAVLVQNLVTIRLGLAAFQGKVDADDLVRLAEEAHAAAPSDGTRDTLVQVLSHRAHARLRRAEPTYEAAAKRCQRSLGAGLIHYLLGGEKSALRDKVAADADVQRVVAIRSEQVKDLPDRTGPSTWAVLQATRPAEAAVLAERIRKNSRAGRKRAIDLALSPLSATVTLDSAWGLRLAGKTAEADELIQRSVKAGVPWPEAAVKK